MNSSTLQYLYRTGRHWAKHVQTDGTGRQRAHNYAALHRAGQHAAVDPYKVRGFLPRPNTPAIRALRERQPRRPARDIMALFGGARGLFRALKDAGFPRNAATVFKWSYPFPKGSGGVIPVSSRAAVLAAAEVRGIALTLSDLEEV